MSATFVIALAVTLAIAGAIGYGLLWLVNRLLLWIIGRINKRINAFNARQLQRRAEMRAGLDALQQAMRQRKADQ